MATTGTAATTTTDPPPLLDPVLSDHSERVELLAELEKALARLPVEVRTVLVLRFAADLDPDQVAAVLAQPIAVVEERERQGVRSSRAVRTGHGFAPAASTRPRSSSTPAR